MTVLDVPLLDLIRNATMFWTNYMTEEERKDVTKFLQENPMEGEEMFDPENEEHLYSIYNWFGSDYDMIEWVLDRRDELYIVIYDSTNMGQFHIYNLGEVYLDRA